MLFRRTLAFSGVRLQRKDEPEKTSEFASEKKTVRMSYTQVKRCRL